MTEQHLELSAYHFEKAGPVGTVYRPLDSSIEFENSLHGLEEEHDLGQYLGVSAPGLHEYENGWIRVWTIDGPVPEQPKKAVK